MIYICNMRDLIIAIDGFSSTGKSTLAKLLAKELGYIHIDSGAMYRAITLYALQNGMIGNGRINESELLPQLHFLDIHFEFNEKNGENEIFLNNENVEDKIREMEVSSHVSSIAKIPEVRYFAVDLQRKMSQNGGVVMDGRDIGTTVFPDADVKIFLNASAEERAKRRYEELLKTDNPASFEEVYQNISDRDKMDTNREISPLKQAEDAILVDNGDLTPKETLAKVLEIIKNKKTPK